MRWARTRSFESGLASTRLNRCESVAQPSNHGWAPKRSVIIAQTARSIAPESLWRFSFCRKAGAGAAQRKRRSERIDTSFGRWPRRRWVPFRALQPRVPATRPRPLEQRQRPQSPGDPEAHSSRGGRSARASPTIRTSGATFVVSGFWQAASSCCSSHFPS